MAAEPTPRPFLGVPHEAFQAGFYRDATMDYAVRAVLGRAVSGASEPGEVLATIGGIPDGDHGAWFEAWHSLGSRLSAIAAELRASGHFDSSAAAYLRASTYLAVAMDAADEDDFATVFHAHRDAWDGFLETTVYSVERVGIPYEGVTLPGYLVRPGDDDDVRPALVLNGGATTSHSALWADAAQGALRRGYAVLFFDGPGQQSALVDQNLPLRPDWETVLTPVLDLLTARTDVDPEKIAVYGPAEAGNLVPRALAFEGRAAAAILDPAVTDPARRWTRTLSAPMAKLLSEGKADAFDRNMEIGMRFDPGAARAWASTARPYRAGGYFATIAAMQEYGLGDVAGRVTTPLFIAAAEDEQFWPGQSAELAELVPADHVLQDFTRDEGANLHRQPLARALTEQRMFDWLDVQLGL